MKAPAQSSGYGNHHPGNATPRLGSPTEPTTTSHYFQPPFKDSYQRNKNSRSKTKNLRCFPACGVDGSHARQTFCGRHVLLHLPPTLTASIAKPIAYAKFCPVSDPISMNQPLPSPAVIRSKTLPTAEWIPVETNIDIVNLDFAEQENARAGLLLKVNPGLQGWHYGWRSNKNTRFTRHCLRVFLFDVDHVVKVLESTSFLVYSGKQFVGAGEESKGDDNVDVHDNNATETRVNTKRKNHEEAGDEVAVAEGFGVDVAVLSKQKIDAKEVEEDADSTQVLPSIRNLLERALNIGEDKGGDMEINKGTRELRDVEDLDEVEAELFESGLELDEDAAVGLIESLLNDDTMSDLTSLATGNEMQIGALEGQGLGVGVGVGVGVEVGVNFSVAEVDQVVEQGAADADAELPRALQLRRIKQIKETLLSELLTAELCAFLSDCSQGSLGQSLCDSLQREDNALSNRFVVDLARTLFRRFQRVITQRVEQDLFTNGLIPECLLNGVRGTQQSTVDVFHRMDDTDALVYDERDLPLLQRFLNLLCSYARLPRLEKRIAETPGESPYKITNRVWVETSNALGAFFGGKMVELGFLKPTIGKLMMRLMSTTQIYCEDGLYCSKGAPMLSFHGYIEMKADGEGHQLHEVSPLFNYVELTGRSYVRQHEILSDGSFHAEECIFFMYEGQQVFIYSDTVINTRDPDKLVIERKLLRRPEPIEARDILECCRTQKSQFLIEGCEFTLVYTAKEALDGHTHTHTT